ncbi:hypothetical protein ACFWVU_19800 [Streptomyces sp. NPDC058686]|uniref:hypothetical protein n=1 Tax=Streptomyces sp. NPDC058686 TaxID=3346599 RepID=UPI003648839B
MRRFTMTAFGLSGSLTAFTLASCSSGTEPAAPVTPTHRRSSTGAAASPLSSAELNQRLLDESDLGEGYTRRPESVTQCDDVTVIGPGMEELGSATATGVGLAFPRKAKMSFTYSGSSSSEVSEELYSDSVSKLSKGIGKIFDAMLSCPSYQVASGSTVVNMSTEEMPAPHLGDEQWSQLLTYSAGGQRSIVKQTAIRTGNVLVLVSGSRASWTPT